MGTHLRLLRCILLRSRCVSLDVASAVDEDDAEPIVENNRVALASSKDEFLFVISIVVGRWSSTHMYSVIILILTLIVVASDGKDRYGNLLADKLISGLKTDAMVHTSTHSESGPGRERSSDQ